MRGHNVISSTDFDELTEIVNRLLPGETLEVTEAGRTIDFSLHHAEVGDLQLYHVFMGEDVPMRVASEPAESGDVLLCAPTSGRGRAAQGKEACDVDPTKGVVRDRGLPFSAEEIDFGCFCLSLPSALIARHAQALVDDSAWGRGVGEAVGRKPVFKLQMDFDRPEARQLLETMRLFHRQLGSLPAEARNPVVMGQWETLLVSQLLYGQPSSWSELLQARPTSSALPYHVKRARDHIHAHAGEKITLADLVSQAGCGYRNLQLAFNEAFGLSPMGYLKRLRLQRVREDLLEAEETEGVAKIAAAWGFTQMGRFTQAYRKQFGVTPSQTLRLKR